MRALICVAQRELREFLAFALEGEFHLDCRMVSDGAQASALIKAAAANPYEIVVCDYQRDGATLIRDALASGRKNHFFCGVDAPPNDPRLEKRKDWLHLFSKSDWLQGLHDALAESMPELMQDERPPELRFARLQIPVLLRLNPLAGDIYVRLSETKYVRVFHKGAQFEQADMERFLANKKIENLYVKQEDLQILTDRLKAALPAQPAAPQTSAAAAPKSKTKDDQEARAKALEILAKQKAADAAAAKATPPEVKEVIQDLSKMLDGIQSISAKLGFSKEVQAVTKQNVAAAIADIRKAPKLSMILGQLRRDKDKYISSHSMLLAHISCALATQMEWKSDMTFNKLTLAAFLHDIAIKNHELAMVGSLKELNEKKEQFSEAEIKDWKLHPMKGAETAKAFSEVPPDVDLIIAQHHERPDGSGYPRGLTNLRLGPLTTVFIVAHDLVDFLFEKNTDSVATLNIDELITKYPGTYKFAQFRKLLQGLQKLKDEDASTGT